MFQIFKDFDLIIAPHCLMIELGNAFMKYVRHNMISAQEAIKLIHDSIELVSAWYNIEKDLLSILRLAHREELSYYDAQYLFIAHKLNEPILTFDKKLEFVAKKFNLYVQPKQGML